MSVFSQYFQGLNITFAIQDLISDGETITSDEEDLWYLRRLDGGLFTLQTVDYILAWIVMDDDGVCYSYLIPPIG